MEKFTLRLEPSKTKLVEFGRFAQRQAGSRERRCPQTLSFLGFTLYCTRNRKGHVTWESFHRIKTRYPMQRPKLYLPYRELQAIAVL
ncbi:MAG: hypothetical protein J5I81_10570 [Nitrococcus mobilis]|nr:hypothetical protein [Nitrococcus mobilis]